MTTVAVLPLLLWLLFGLAVGASHFALLRWNATLYLTAAGPLRALAIQLLRLGVTTALLALAAGHGATALLAAAIGVLLARLLVMQLMEAVP